MAMNKTPGVNLILGFTLPQQVEPGKTYSGYVDYISREDVQAEKNEWESSHRLLDDLQEEVLTSHPKIQAKSDVESYQGYLGYMDRDQAKANTSDGMFDLYRDQITSKQRYFYEKKHEEAFKKNALLWQPIISFDNDWLREQGILKGNIVQDDFIKKATRKAVNELIKERELDVHWVGQIHYNTGNIHVHVSMVEKSPLNIETLDDPKKHGILSLASNDQAKSKIVNTFLDRTPQQQKINDLIRNQMVEEARSRDFTKRYEKRFEFLSKRLSTYQYGKLKPHEKKWIHDLTQTMLTNDFKVEYDTFKQLIHEESRVYQRAYGTGERHLYERYAKNREQDLSYRFGNAVLSQIKHYRQERLSSFSDEKTASSRPGRSHRSFSKLRNQLRKENQKALKEYEKLQQDLAKGEIGDEMER